MRCPDTQRPSANPARHSAQIAAGNARSAGRRPCSGAGAFATNRGGALDFETEGCVGQVKHVRRLSLAALEALAVEMERVGLKKSPPKPVVMKRRAGRGQETPRLVVCIEVVWRELRRRRETPAGP